MSAQTVEIPTQPEKSPQAVREVPPDEYFEDTVEVEAGGHRFTLFVQIIPSKMQRCTPDGLKGMFELLRIYSEMQDLKRFGKILR